jgi:HSP90 family molecular chaperone
MKPKQQKIYYVTGSSKEHIEKSPYYEPFLGSEIPVIMLYNQADEIIFAQMQTYKNFILTNIESSFDEIEQDVLRAHTKQQIEDKD